MANQAPAPPRALQGMRDFLPERMILRHWVIGELRTVFESFGFEPIDTPSVEYAETLRGKYGEEADKLIYQFPDRGGREVGLRYDLTVPLARLVANNPDLPKPFKRYHMGPVWRAERPQRGRYREFWQCDVDTVGATSPLADAEIVTVVAMALGRLKLGQFTIKLNDRRLLSALARSLGVEGEAARALFRSIDKLEKIGTAGVRAELRERGITDRTADALFRFLELTGSDEAEKLTRAGQYFDDDPGVRAGVDSLLAIGSCLAASGVPAERFTYDFSMVRGLDYYTGPIFETFVEEPRIGSISSGGRYDGLIGLFVGRDVPATGGSLGLERIIDVVEELQLQPTALAGTVTEVLVTIFAAELTADSLGLARDLRAAGVRTEVVLTGDRLPNQLRYAGRRKVPFVTIVGPDEVNAGNVLVRDMDTGQQEAVPRAAAAAELRRRLDAAAATIRT